MSNNGFEPKIVGFLCNWCSYAGADLAGTARLKYPANLRVIRVMCSGRVSPEFVVKALRAGADGVMVLGCHIGDCHYQAGNHRAAKRIAILRRLLNYMGIDPRRVRLEWVSASEAQRFTKIVKEFTDDMKALGPNPMKKVKV
ncbi:MAG: hydrogenase iron-sulfur subunit [Dehalococcoidales bacterium]|nr:hydrogenase iron-sulfur subunit [Dehalococcoidales bacterium]